jgi:CheY-like chemotaxis protein
MFSESIDNDDGVQQRSPHQQPESLSLRLRILVVEDDDDIRRLNTEILAGSGYEVDAAVDGAKAWEALQLHDYDLVITDNNMPGITGLELIKRLHEFHPQLPVIMATGHPPALDFAGEYPVKPKVLRKPYVCDDLLNAVTNAFAAAKA